MTNKYNMLSVMVITEPLSRVTSTIGSDTSGAIFNRGNLLLICLFGGQVPFLPVHFLANLGAFSSEQGESFLEILESLTSLILETRWGLSMDCQANWLGIAT